ncbi:MAG TPA: hypothetical protein DEQ80_11425 [Anaerolinea thermolimosa]|uniref:Uncharacterized protein n=1 Tax=Anaerolinea thermolimosa TaxID=229919 RepID=A0A3D1JIQ0_9CHLR|nr:hypothetical protein [Anaerolinea thermolimosa]
MKTSMAIYLRIFISLLIGLGGAWLVSESSYHFLKDPQTRDDARQIVLVIPPGTAERIAAGEDALTLPSTMTFVEGDLLIVRNEDSVSHQLGPVWVPPGSSGVLEVGAPNSYTYDCSFQKSRVFGIEVLPALTGSTRLEGVLAMGLPTSLMLALYSFLIFPLKTHPSPSSERPA